MRQARGGERRHLTVLFCDLVDSTGIAGRLDPEDWHKIAAEYPAGVSAAVTRFSGHVAKYLGDGVMAYFGWPEAHEDDTELAIRGRLAIIDEVAALNGRLAPEHGITLPVRVGIHWGSLVVVTENLNSKILMVEPAQDRNRHDLTDPLPAPEKRRVLVER